MPDFDFNLPDIDTRPLAETGIDLPLKRLDGTPLLNALKKPVTVHIFGSDSVTYRKASRALSRSRIDRAQKMQGAQVQDPDSIADANDAEAIEMLVKCTTGWSGVLDSKDKEVPFSAAAAKVFYEQFPAGRDQVDMAIVDRTLFITASSEA